MMQGQFATNTHTCFTRAAFWLLFAGVGLVFLGGLLGLRHYHVRRIEAWELRAGQIRATMFSSPLFKSAMVVGLTREQMQTALGVKLPRSKPPEHAPPREDWARVDDRQSGYWFWIMFDRRGESCGTYLSLIEYLPEPRPPGLLLFLELARLLIDSFGWLLGMLLVSLAFAFREQRRSLVWIALAFALLHLGTVALSHFGWISAGTVEASTVEPRSVGWTVSGVIVALACLLLLFTARAKSTGPLCPQCGYNLTGNESGVCPECGQPISPTLRQAIRLAAGEPDPETVQVVERLEQLQSNQPERSVDP